MEILIIYLLKVFVATALFYGLHMLLLKNETFLTVRRIYFLFALIFSLAFPFISIGWQISEATELPLPVYFLSEIEVFVEGQMSSISTPSAGASITLNHVLIVIASLGSLFLLLRFLVQVASLALQLHKMKMWKFENYRIVEVNDTLIPSFSFFQWIVINTSNVNEMQKRDILCHETAHANQYHSIDVVLYELFCIILWWNPFAWLLKNEMKLNLEYLADKVVQENIDDLKQYQYTLLQIVTANTGAAFINNFNISHLKKRITMMNTKRSSKGYLVKYIMIVPLVLALVLGNVAYAVPKNMSDDAVELNLQDTIKSSIFTVVERMPKYPGGETEMMKFIGQNLRYPIEAQKAGAEGRVIVRFVIDEAGKITDAKSIRNAVTLENELDEIVVVGYLHDGEKTEQMIKLADVQSLIDEEALRVVNEMPNWEPGKQKGKIVPVYFTLPILFRLK